MNLKVQKWGNSLAIRFPKALMEMLGLERESVVDVQLSDGQIVIEPAATNAFSIEELVAGITEENCHEELLCGKPAGREAW
ncbi:MAG: AbrB/MazE/SpoVT family DNA-binding domain-containing protein [Candidatus Wallbacteria bacterium]|nr:AbrB/MazE/SpoVT family DNA-binding domain-containing protein [Candidatus Wallbacteria bacterium]